MCETVNNVALLPQVNYIDFGNSEVVSLSAIRQEMPFMEVPQQCLQLVLRGIEPVSSLMQFALVLNLLCFIITLTVVFGGDMQTGRIIHS